VNPYLHDGFRHLSRPMTVTLVILAAAIGVSGTALSLTLSGTLGSFNAQWDCASDQGYHCLLFTYDPSTGRPVSGVSVDAVATPSNGSAGFGRESNATTGNDGLGWVSWSMPPGNYSVMFTLRWHSVDQSIQVGDLLGSGDPFTAVHHGFYPQSTDLQVLLIGPGRSPPRGVSVGYTLLPRGNFWNGNPAIPHSEFTTMGSVNAFVSTFPLSPVAAAAGNRTVVFGLFDSSGAVLYESMLGGDLAPPSTTTGPGAGLLYLILEQGGLFLPLFGVLSAYSIYGRARVSGTLEAVLARPVSRTGLTILRYGTIVAAAAIALVALLVALQVTVFAYTGNTFPLWVVAALFGAFFVEWMSLAGLTLLLSRLLRTSGGLVGAGVGLFLMFVLAWPLLANLTAAFQRASFAGPTDFFSWVAFTELPNPAEFHNFVGGVVLGIAPGFPGLDLPGIGITSAVVVALGLAFVVLPALGFYALARWRD
jgi:hypothetical protein